MSQYQYPFLPRQTHNSYSNQPAEQPTDRKPSEQPTDKQNPMNKSLQKSKFASQLFLRKKVSQSDLSHASKKRGRFIEKPKDVELPTSVLLVLPDRPPPSQPPLPASQHLHLHLHQLHHQPHRLHLLMPFYSQDVPPTSSSPLQVLSLDGGGEQRGDGDADGEISFLMF